MAEHEEPTLARDLVELGRAMDQPPSARTVATIVAAAAEQAPPRPRTARVLLAAASVAAVLALSVHAESLLRDQATEPATAAETGMGDCSGWATMDVVSLSDLNLHTGWNPPSMLGLWSAQQYFTRASKSSWPAAMVHYTRGADMLSLERYAPGTQIDSHPTNAAAVVPTQVGPYPGQWARSHKGSFYRVNTGLWEGGADLVSIICDGSRLSWTSDDGSVYALSGSVSEGALLAVAESLP
ncbi:hypothetical protein JOD54_003966 [Actinokineospora baliensis]|uniref:hypothetical protein n=1 Tax=Actinokineospora baliensis TaxID=547056 RepID=UPI001958AD20|nr:hypothetical protein [Actinokineospora baliensis]MBM7773762.1 hypothetical protein [Actinokineospora baliensis]